MIDCFLYNFIYIYRVSVDKPVGASCYLHGPTVGDTTTTTTTTVSPLHDTWEVHIATRATPTSTPAAIAIAIDDAPYGPWIRLTTPNASTTTARAKGLAPATTYDFRVAAVTTATDDKQGSEAYQGLYTDPPTPGHTWGNAGPGAPRSLAPISSTSHTVGLVWSIPLYDRGVAVTSYEVQARKFGSTGEFALSVDTSTNTPAVVFPGLDSSTTYEFRVAATNAYGRGRFSSPTVLYDTLAALVPDVPDGSNVVPSKAQPLSGAVCLNENGKMCQVSEWSRYIDNTIQMQHQNSFICTRMMLFGVVIVYSISMTLYIYAYICIYRSFKAPTSSSSPRTITASPSTATPLLIDPLVKSHRGQENHVREKKLLPVRMICCMYV